MSLAAIILIAVSAVMHAGWNLLSKGRRPNGAFFLVACMAGAALLSYPGAGCLFAGFPFRESADSNLVDAAWRAVREAARAGGGSALLESAPGWAKSSGDVFGDPCEATPLFRALKQRFDPGGVLNPGRFAGRL